MAPISHRRERFDERVKFYSDQRTGLYNAANRACPRARETERRLLIDRLDLDVPQQLTVCDTMAGGGYVAEGIREITSSRARVICVEPSASFAGSIHPHFQSLVCPLDAIDLDDETVDRVCNLAGIHHIDLRREFFAEAFRILKKGGRFAVADVLEDSAPARWLNGPVDRFSDIGHDGTFLDHGELSGLLLAAGFMDIEEVYHRYTWDFPGPEALVAYCKDLFRLTRATIDQVRDALNRTLEVTKSDAGCHLHWSLVYASGRKA